MSEIEKKIDRLIRRIVAEEGWTKKSVAKIIGCSLPTVYEKFNTPCRWTFWEVCMILWATKEKDLCKILQDAISIK